MNERTAAFLIAYPYLTGVMAGASSNRLLSLGIFTVSGIFIVPEVQLLILELSQGDTWLWRIWGTVVFWAFGGVWFGILTKHYIRMFTPIGYFWTLGNALLVTCMTSIFFEGLLPYFKTLEMTPDLLNKIYSYAYLVPAGLILIIGTSIKGTRFGIKYTLRKLGEFITVLGFLGLVSEQFWQTTLLNVTWWLPGIDQPFGYVWFFTFALMGIAMMPGYFLTRNKNIPDGLLGPGAVMLNNKADEFQPKLGEPFSVHYVMPPGWVLEKEERDEFNYRLRILPFPGNRYAFVEAAVFKFTEDTITDQNHLRRLSLMSVHAQNGSIQKETFITWQDVLAHEVYYQTWSYVYMLHYVVHTYEVYILWFSRQPEEFRRNILEVQGFATKFHIWSKLPKELIHV